MPKKQSNIKKTDLKGQKPWLKKMNISEYKIETVAPNKTILIVCEGQTEELYFKSFLVSTLTVKLFSLGQSKIQLVQNTERIQQIEQCDEVWCVFDMDIKLDVVNCIADFDNSIAKAKDLGYNVAYSNDAFELWFYLHYQFTDNENHRSFYYNQLSKLWDVSYERVGKKWKFCTENYKRLHDDPRANQDLAIQRAEHLFGAKQDLKYHKQNPVTRVYELVKVLNENRKK
jgi:hypothetical protein